MPVSAGYRVFWLTAFRTVTKTRSAVHLTMLASNGVVNNKYRNMIVQCLTADCLFGK